MPATLPTPSSTLVTSLPPGATQAFDAPEFAHPAGAGPVFDAHPWMIEQAALRDAYAPIQHELDVSFDAQSAPERIIGQIPDDLEGMYVRNGPSPIHAPIGRYHWFDGDGMLQAVRFKNGQVRQISRWVQTQALHAERAAGRALSGGLKSKMPAGALIDDALKNTANTDVKAHAGRLLAMWYRGGDVYCCDPDTLATQGTLAELTDEPRLKGLQISAHGKVCPRTGEFLFFAYGNRPPYMHYGVLGADSTLKTLIPVALPGPRLPHDMAFTEHYSILHDFPLINDPEALTAGRYSLSFDQDLPSRFAIVPRHGSEADIRWFEASPRYMLHVANAWEETNAAGQTVIVMVGTPYQMPKRFDGSLDVQRLLFTIGTNGTDYELYEWRFNLATGQTQERVLDDILTVEFPVIHPDYQGVKNRYLYMVQMGRTRTIEQPRFSGLVRHDLKDNSSVVWHPGPGYWFSEPGFAPRKGGSGLEDDGYLVGYVWNGREQRSECWVTDARDLTRGPVARIVLPGRVPHGFHAGWVQG